MLQKLHWSQILKEGKVNIPNTAVFLFTSVYWSLWTTAILSWCQGTSLHRQLFTLLQRGLCQGSQQMPHSHNSDSVQSGYDQKEPYSDPAMRDIFHSIRFFEVMHALLRYYHNAIFNSKGPKEWGLCCNLSEQCFCNRELKWTVCAECPGV